MYSNLFVLQVSIYKKMKDCSIQSQAQKPFSMANSLFFISTCIFILFCSPTLGSRPYFPQNATTASLLAASNADGICSSMVQPHGYTCEEHKVTTKDGYILSLQRIPLGRAGSRKGSRVPVLLQHGLLMVINFLNLSLL